MSVLGPNSLGPERPRFGGEQVAFEGAPLSEPRHPASATLPARPGEFPALELGALTIWPPVVLAPMAGITNYPFRSLCRRFGAGLYVSEMIAARPLVEGREKTRKLADFGEDETPRSLQLYGVDPHYVGEAVAYLAGEGRVDHIDLNFGCPVPKVTRKGGGAAIPLKPLLLASILRAAVSRAGKVPVTMKMRMGINDSLRTDLTAGKVAEAEGVTAVGLHARTAAQLYDGQARWEAITELKQALGIPVLGNGDIWEASDALAMMRETGCDAVIVGRGCLGRPWLFRELVSLFDGHEPPAPPKLGEVVDTLIEHAQRLSAWMGEGPAIRSFRRHAVWYTKGFRSSAQLRSRLTTIHSLDDLRRIVAECDREQAFPEAGLRARRGKRAGTQVVSLPEGYLENDDWRPVESDQAVDGG